MKKGLIVAAGVVVIAGVGMVATKNAYDDAIAKQIAAMDDVYEDLGIEYSHETISSSFFSIKDKFSFKIGDAFFDKIMPDGSQDAPEFTLVVDNNCSIYPFYLSCSDELSLPGLDIPEDVAEKLPEFDYDLNWSVNAITRNVNTSASLEKFEIEDVKDGVNFKFDDLDFESNSGMSMDKIQYTLNWDGMTFTSQAGMNFSLGKSESHGDMTHVAGMTFVGSSEVSVESVRSEVMSNELFNLSDLKMRSHTDKSDADIYSIRYELEAEKIDAQTGFMPVSLEDLYFDITLDGLSETSLLLMNDIQMDPSYNDEERIQVILDEFGKNAPVVNLNKVSVEYNDVPMTIDGTITVGSFTADDFKNGSIAEKADGKMHGFVSKKAAENLPQFAPVLEQYMQMGLATLDEDGNYVTEVIIKDRTLSANGNTVTQF